MSELEFGPVPAVAEAIAPAVTRGGFRDLPLWKRVGAVVGFVAGTGVAVGGFADNAYADASPSPTPTPTSTAPASPSVHGSFVENCKTGEFSGEIDGSGFGRTEVDVFAKKQDGTVLFKKRFVTPGATGEDEGKFEVTGNLTANPGNSAVTVEADHLFTEHQIASATATIDESCESSSPTGTHTHTQTATKTHTPPPESSSATSIVPSKSTHVVVHHPKSTHHNNNGGGNSNTQPADGFTATVAGALGTDQKRGPASYDGALVVGGSILTLLAIAGAVSLRKRAH